MPSYPTLEIAQRVGGELAGPGDVLIVGVETLESAQPGQITFIGQQRYAAQWPGSRASAALVTRGIAAPGAEGAGRAIIYVADADLALALVLELFAPAPPRAAAGVHFSAVVDATAQIGANAAIGPHCVIGARARLGDGCVLYAHVTVLDDAELGPQCVLWPGVVVRDRCRLGARGIVHPNAVIGADGFGYRPAPGGRGLVKIPQIGTVEIGDDVEIGANTCIDRGKFSATVIGDGTKIDNLCQIAHNCRIGRCCLLAGQVGLAGSVTLGDGVILGGKAGVRDHVTIGAGAEVAAYAAVMGDVPPGAQWGGYPAQEARAALRQIAAIRKLPGLVKSLRTKEQR